MEFRILGSLEVLDADGHAVTPTAPRLRGLLALLLLHAGETVTVDRLIDELWDDEPPATAMHVVQNLVSQLRRTLGDRVERHGQSYRLRVEPDEFDLARFRMLVQEAKAQREAVDPAAAAETLRRALALWRGPALADLGYEPPALAERDRLEELRVVTLEECIAAELDVGEDGELVGELEQLVREHPLRERLRGELMLALYRAGRQADALSAYREGRSLLVEQLGLEPGDDLRALESAILRHDRSLDPPRTSSPAAPLVSIAARRRRRRAFLLALAACGLAAPVAVVLATRLAHGSAVPAVGPDSVGVVDPRSGRLLAAVRVGSAPVALATGAGSVWVANAADGTLSRIDPKRRSVSATIGIGGPLADLAADADSVWAVTGSEGSLVEVDPRTNTVVSRRDLSGTNSLMPAGAYSLGVGGGRVWIGTNAGGGRLLRLNPGSGRITTVLRNGWAPSEIVSAPDALWTTFRVGGTVRIEPGAGAVTASVDDPPDGMSVAAGAGSIWVGQYPGAVWQLDPASASVVRTIAVAGVPFGIAVCAGKVWVAGGRSGVLSEIDPRGGSVVRSLHLRGALLDVACGAGSLWVAVAEPTAAP